MNDPIHLLKRLNASIRPVRSTSSAGGSNSAFEARGFDRLLTLVAGAAPATGQPVQCDLEGDGAFGEEDLARLAAAADTAKRAGFERTVVLIDGRGVLLDVSGRRITAELSATEDPAAFDVDGAVFVPALGTETNLSALRGPDSFGASRLMDELINRARRSGQATTPPPAA